MEQYFEKDPSVQSQEKKFKVMYKQHQFLFYTDNGVFSKNKVDDGSLALINGFLSEKKEYHHILDLGCGYGPIGIIISTMKKIKTDFCDINNRAVLLSEKNIKENKIENARVFVSDGFLKVDRKYDAILLNPPIRAGKEVVYKLYEDSIDYLFPGGAFYIVIQKKQGAKSSMDKLMAIYKNVECIRRDKGYMTLKAVKLSE